MEASKIFKWVFIIIVPLLFVVGILIVIMLFSDQPFANHLKRIGAQIPIVSGLVKEDANGNGPANDPDKDIEQLFAQIQQQQEEIKNLEERLIEKDEEIAQYKEEIAKLEQQNLESSSVDGSSAGEDRLKKARDMLEEMSPKVAASIVSEMETSDVIALLETMDSKALGDILAKMEPERAAELTNLLLDNE